MFHFNTRSKTSIFGAYSLVSVVGFAVLWFGVRGGESLTLVESFLAFYGFFCTTVVFYMLASHKSMLENAFYMIHTESNDRSREIETVYRSIGENADSIRQELYNMNRNFHYYSKHDCHNSASCTTEKSAL